MHIPLPPMPVTWANQQRHHGTRPGSILPPPSFVQRDMEGYAKQYGAWVAEACAQLIEREVPPEVAARIAATIREAFPQP